MIVKGHFASSGDGNSHCRYELVNGRHYVYFESKNIVRKLQMPNSGFALDFAKRLALYDGLKDKIN